MAENDLFNEFVAREISTMSIFLSAKATRTAVTIDEYIQTRLLQGADPQILEQELLKDLEEGGRIFGEFRNAVKATVSGVSGRARDNALFSEIGVEDKYRWVAVLINTCPDCLERHGRELTYREWESEGLPRTGATVCRENCKCMLLPADTAVIEPIQRGKK